MAFTYEEAVKEFGELEICDKEHGETISWIGCDMKGPCLFSFDDGKTIHNIWGSGKNELTPEQIEILKKENPEMAGFYLHHKG